MTHFDAEIARLLRSPAFARSRAAAVDLADDPIGMMGLLDGVAGKRFGIGQLDDQHGRLDIDIACSVIEARIEEYDEGVAIGFNDLEPTTSARLRLVISALHYLVIENDTIPDMRPEGHVDDVTIVRWVTQVANGSLPPIDPPAPVGEPAVPEPEAPGGFGPP